MFNKLGNSSVGSEIPVNDSPRAGAQNVALWDCEMRLTGVLERAFDSSKVEPAALDTCATAPPIPRFAQLTDTLNDPSLEMLSQLEDALKARVAVMIDDQDINGNITQRTVLPAALFFWGNVWTLDGWCNLRDDIRMFRVNRIFYMHRGARFSAARAREISLLIKAERNRAH